MPISRSSPTAGSADEALDAACQAVRVDIILLDVEMPGVERARGASRRSSRRARGARVLIVSSSAERRRRGGGAGAGARRRRHARQARRRQFRRPLLPRCSPSGCGGSAGGEAAAEPSDVPAATAADRDRPRQPAARSAASRSAPRPAASTPSPQLLRALPARIRRADPRHPASARRPSCRSFARQLEAACGPPASGSPRTAGAPPGRASCSRPATPISTSTQHGSRRAACGSRPRPRRAAARPRSIRCSPRSPRSTAAAALGVVLSGMGRDGLGGGRRLVDRGGAILVQDRDSSAVWGMPGAVAEPGLACGHAAAGRARREIGAARRRARWSMSDASSARPRRPCSRRAPASSSR